MPGQSIQGKLPWFSHFLKKNHSSRDCLGNLGPHYCQNGRRVLSLPFDSRDTLSQSFRSQSNVFHIKLGGKVKCSGTFYQKLDFLKVGPDLGPRSLKESPARKYLD